MADAIFHDTVEAVAQSVRAALTAASYTATTYRRRKPVLLESDSVPCVVVCPGSEGERIVFEAFGGSVVYGYPVTCLIVSKGNTISSPAITSPEAAATTADTATASHMELRQVVRNAVYKRTLSGVSSVFNGEIVMGNAVTIAGGGQSLYIVSAVTVTHWSLESQTW